jgi:hypothetical protein
LPGSDSCAVNVRPSRPPDAQQVEEAGRDGRGFHLFGLVAAGEIEAAIAEEGDPVEDAVLVAPLDEVLQAGLHALGHQAVERRVGFPHHRQPLRIAKGHGAQQHGVEDGKDGGVGSDAQRERDGRRQGEAGILAQDSKSVSH